jgi:AcrR family transcriptional regulator
MLCNCLARLRGGGKIAAIGVFEKREMPSQRRIGTADSKTREQLLDAAELLMREEGYAGVTSRRLGSRAGISSQLVHYYFRTMDDLFLEVFRRRAEQGLREFTKAMQLDESLGAIWHFATPGGALNIEFVALANHRKAVRAEIARYAERFRELQLEAVTRVLAKRGLSAEAWPPAVILVAMTGVTQVMALEKALGVTAGHDETLAYIDRLIEVLESTGTAAPSKGVTAGEE